MSETEALNKLAEILGDSSSTAVMHYTTWFIASAISWVLIGIITIWCAFRFSFDHSEMTSIGKILIKAILIAIGALIVACNIPDLVSPQGMAIHQLIRDVRG